MKKFAVVLAGCGVFDGAEIHEATLTMLEIKNHGADYQCFAPDISQHHVINHLTGEETKENRNVLVESARIARGNIKALSELNADDFDALIFPGGFGVAKNLSTIAFDGVDAIVNEDIEKAVKSFYIQKKPIGALCISPVLMTKILGDVQVTVGNDKETVETIEKMGGTHLETAHGDVVYDEENNLFTTPCYMLDADISQIHDGAYNIIDAMLGVM